MLKQQNLRIISITEEEGVSTSLENIFDGIIQENFTSLARTRHPNTYNRSTENTWEIYHKDHGTLTATGANQS